MKLWIFLVLILFLTMSVTEAQKCKPSHKLRGKKPPKQCSECCKPGKLYNVYTCSPSVSHRTQAIMTIKNFEKGGDGGGPSECDGRYHNNDTPVVALSTGWFNKRKRCHKFINIHANGRTVRAKVVDECDSTKGCDKEHGFQPPCDNNIVDASRAVWQRLGVRESDWGWMQIQWSDA